MMASKNYYIYIHQNKINLKIYVGVTTNLKNRWNDQRCAAFNIHSPNYHDPFYRAIRKYSWDNFNHYEIESFLDKQESLDAEKFWIEYFRSNIKLFGSNYGYNQSGGGEFLPDINWRARKSLSKRMSGNKNPMFGKKHSVKTINQISNTKKLNPLSKENRIKLSNFFTLKFSEFQIKNICSDTRSQTEIAKTYGVSRIVIKRILTENGINSSLHLKSIKNVSKEKLIVLLKGNFTCDEIAKKLSISSITLYRKIKSLLGADGVVSARKLIRDEKFSIDSDH